MGDFGGKTFDASQDFKDIENHIWNFIQEILNDKNSCEENYRNKLSFTFKLFVTAKYELLK